MKKTGSTQPSPHPQGVWFSWAGSGAGGVQKAPAVTLGSTTDEDWQAMRHYGAELWIIPLIHCTQCRNIYFVSHLDGYNVTRFSLGLLITSVSNNLCCSYSVSNIIFT